MNALRAAIACLALLPAAAAANEHVAAHSPNYAPGCGFQSGHFDVPAHYTAPASTPYSYVTPSHRTPYAYGWFGVPRRCHGGLHYGYYHSYKQWSVR